MRFLLSLAAPLFLQSAAAQTPVDFRESVQPILTKSCAGCHGEKAQLGSLRLDAKAGAFRGGVSGAAIVPGKPEASPLYQRVMGQGGQARMPMGQKPLPGDQLAILERWIKEGAVWPDGVGAADAGVKKHWAYVAPVRAALPAVKNTAWAKNAIDRFVLARLEKEGLKPSPRADKVTLFRRLSLDLTGLPPEPADVDAFLKDQSPKAYENAVDRLLASPHYGERWGRHWLDAARYADSDGFEKDKQRQVWFFRDWVVNALNRDMPYDRFVIEQIAGDLLPSPTQDQLVATGFLRNSMINEEGGIDPEQFRMEAMFDRMDAIGKAVLGVTIQCAQCHNHKFDPLTQEEYYKIFAFLNNSHESNIAVYTAAEQQKRAEIFAEIARIEGDIQHRTPEWQKQMAAWEKRASAGLTNWTVLRPEVDDISTGGQKYVALEDGSLLASGYAPTKHTVKLTVADPAIRRITGFRFELLTDPNLPLGGPGRSTQGMGALTEFIVEVGEKKVKFARASADIELPEAPIPVACRDKDERAGKKAPRVTGPSSFAIDGKDETAWGLDNGPARRNQARKAVFIPESPVEVPAGTPLVIQLAQKHGGWNSDDNQNYNLGRMRVSITGDAAPVLDPLPMRVRELLAKPAAQRTASEQHSVFRYWRTTEAAFLAANARIEELWNQHPEGSSQLILNERDDRRSTAILMRGDFLKPGKPVDAGVPAFLHPLDNPAPDRLAFAKWLVDRRSPTTARTYVNRLWQNYFGQGLVPSSEDLGKQAEAPSHPELLDWLAVDFMESGWSRKRLHKTIVMSATYQQSSTMTPELEQRDPRNVLLARGARLRVEGEIVRDIALAASGLLTRDIGGPPVYPPAPEFLFQPPVSYGPKNWDEEKGAGRYRRALYTHRYRSVPYPVLTNFDTPNGDFACVRRSRSNTPLQALTTLNEPLFNEAAAALGRKALAEGGKDNAAKVRYAFRRCVARDPSPEESAELLAFLDRQKPRGEQGAWTALARVLLNLDETITKE